MNHLDDVGPEYEFSTRGLTSSGKMTWTIPDRIRRFIFRWDLDFIDEITKAVDAKTPLHLVPFSRNFVAIDSIIYDPNGVLTFSQVTSLENTILTSRVSNLFKAGSKKVHRLRASALQKTGSGASSLLCHCHQMRGPSNRNGWEVILSRRMGPKGASICIKVRCSRETTCLDLADSSRSDYMDL